MDGILMQEVISMLRIIILGMLVETNADGIRRLYINAGELISHNVQDIVFFNVHGKINFFFDIMINLLTIITYLCKQ